MTYPEHPSMECDVVMKGGITSGVIYPRAICKLAETYRLRSVGGSSAGAIAAAGAAAAEYGRATGGFDVLWALPDTITAESPAGGPVLFRLFQPTTQSYPLYQVFTAGMGRSTAPAAAAPHSQTNRREAGHPSVAAGVLRKLAALIAQFWRPALAGALLGIILLVISEFGSGLAVVAGLVGGIALTVLGALLGAAWGAATRLAGVARAGFGLCTGMPGPHNGTADALTPFLHDQFQAMAGPSLHGNVLTFGDLADRGIELRVMTTNLSRRQPIPMPWITQEYFFEPAEMSTLFPPDVVQWMIDHPPTTRPDGTALSPSERTARDLLRAQAGSKKPWPAPRDVPVVVATRMSLSFPLLITAVPLYAVNYLPASDHDGETTPADPSDAGDTETLTATPRFDVNWFSDGGICANLPVHFFDAPLPNRPTFAIDLQEFPPGRSKKSNQTQNCYLPIEDNAGLHRSWTALSPDSTQTIPGLKALGAFLSQIVNTARGWLDAAQLVTPGYRDRVVTIYHDDTKGGMNLAMPKDAVDNLAARGEAAAALLVEKFTGTPDGKPPQWGWNNQRWIRFRTATAGLDTWLTKFYTNYRTAPAAALPYAQLAGPNAAAPLPSYGLSDSDRATVNDLTAGLLTLAGTWNTNHALSANPPRPRPQLRLMPDDGAASPTAERAADPPT